MSTMDERFMDDLKKGVRDLGDAIADMKRGQVDKETVERIARDVVAQQDAANPVLAARNRSRREMLTTFEYEDGDGYREPKPTETLPARGRERVEMARIMEPEHVAKMTGRSVETVREWQQAGDALLFLSAAHVDEAGNQLPVNELNYYRDKFEPMTQAMDTATTAEGLEYVPRELSGSLIERVNLELRVAGLFPVTEMTSQPYDIPGFAINRTRLGTHTEQTADTGQTGIKIITAGTRKISLTAKKFAGEVIFSRELEEDALVAMIPFLQQEILDYLSADLENAVINGDTSGSHQDSDVTSSDDPRKIWTGLRKATVAAAKTDLSNAAPTVSNSLRVNRKKMGKYGVRSDQLAHITSISAYIQLLADANVLTLDKYGPNATILSGELGKADGAPLIVSEYVRQDLNATGVYDGTTTNRTQVLTVNRRGFVFGNRRGITVQLLLEKYAEYDQSALIITLRRAFEPRFPIATETIVANTYNVAT